MANSSDPRIPLHSIDAEMGVLGSMLLSKRMAEQISSTLQTEQFYRPAHQLIFNSMRQLVSMNRPIDFLTLKDELTARGQLTECGGEDYILQLAEFVPSAANGEYYAEIVADRSQLRNLDSAGREIITIAHDPDGGDAKDRVDRAEQIVFDVGRKDTGNYFQPIESLAKEFFIDVDKFLTTGIPMSGRKVGFYDLDEVTTGFKEGDFVIIGARPAMGKTSLVLDFALNVARDLYRKQEKGSVAVFSLEMGADQLTRRMVSMLSGVSTRILQREGELSMDKYERLADACDELYQLPIYIDETSDISALDLRQKCRRLQADKGLSIIIVDYLQLMRGSSRRPENRVQEISEIARTLKTTARLLKVPVIALSQLSRAVENREDKRPQLSDIRESGSIEAEADIVMMLYRDSYYKAKEENRREVENFEDVETAEVIIAKHRNGPIGNVALQFQSDVTKFSDLARPDYLPERRFE
jgi:replicative DNA helicase